MKDQEGGVRVPQQERSRETRNRILAAGEKLFSQKGFHKTNSKEIAREAGVSIGSFYAYFEHKKALFVELVRIHTEQILNTIASAKPEDRRDIEPRELISGLVEKILAAHEISPEFHRELTVMLHSDPEVRALMDGWEEEAIASIYHLLKLWGNRLRISDLDAAAILIHDTVEAAVHSTKLYPTDIEEERLVKELTDMLSRYLFA